MSTEELDSHTLAIYLEVPGNKVVLLQGIFENYEGLATVRTLDIRKSLVCILTTRSVREDCMAALEGIKELVPWREVERPEEASKIMGYFRGQQ